MARPEVSVSDVRAALKAVGLEGAVENLPAGLGTELLASGQPLSESQRIKLGFARAIATQPRLLVVDGALDRLGSTDRSSILRMLTDARGGWTLILLTRDPSLAAQLPVHFMLTPKPEAR
jgi:ABC-type multidrug transport system fused ATPase/permease subunit